MQEYLTVGSSRTPAQQRQRTKWGNVVQMYKGVMPLINNGFEQKSAGCNDFQMFMKVNMPFAITYLTKQEVAGGGCVAAPYQITQGTLPSIVTTGSGDNVRTDIKVDDLTIDENTTVKDFSIAVVNKVTVQRQYDDGYHIVEAEMPCLITALSELNEPRYMTPAGIFKACDTSFTVWGIADLKDVEDGNLGLNGSPTKIAKASDKVRKGAGEKVTPDSPEDAVNYIVGKLKEKHII